MRLLPDTHVVIWTLAQRARVVEPAATVLADPANEVLLSAVVVWEIAIKTALGKLDSPPELVADVLEAGARPLPVSLDHAAAVADLPLHHSDPFDRLLVAQAQLENATIVSGDPALRAYAVPVLWEAA